MFHCGACEFLKCLAEQIFDNASDEGQFCSRAAALFVVLMLDANPITKQLALETFSYFAHVTKYPQVIAGTVSSNPQLQTEVINFFEGVPAGSSQKSVIDHLKCFEQCFKHKCKPSVVQYKSNGEDTGSNPCKRPKTCVTEEQISNAIKRIEQDLYSIEEYSCKSLLNKTNTNSLISIYERIDKIVNTFEM